jgi:hypothetical protein
VPEVGQTLSHFRILGKLGRGGMGEVFLAEDTSLHGQVAVKLLTDAFLGGRGTIPSEDHDPGR